MPEPGQRPVSSSRDRYGLVLGALLLAPLLCCSEARAEWQTFDNSNGLAGPHVFQILEDRKEILWFWTSGGLSRYDGVVWTSFNAPSFPIGKPLADHNGNIWYLTAGGVVRFRDGSSTVYTSADGLPGTEMKSIMEDGQGRIWVACGDAGGPGGGAARFDGASWVAHTQANGFPGRAALDIVEDRHGNTWVRYTQSTPGDEGLARFDGTAWRVFNQTDGLAEGVASSLIADRSGDLWVGHPSGGVSHYDGSVWTALLGTGDALSPLYKDQSGRIWFKSFGFTVGLAIYDNGTWTRIGYDEGIPFSSIGDITEDRAGHIWIVSGQFTSEGAAFYDDVRWRRVGTTDGLVSADVHAILSDNAGNLWFATEWGVSRHDGSGWREHDLGAIGNVATATSDHLGRIWFGTESSGVARLDGDSLKQFTTADGLAHNSVPAILEPVEGTLWFGTWGGGISIFDGSTWRTITTADGLPTNLVRSLYKDRSGILWVGTSLGVGRFDGVGWTTLPDPSDGVLSNVQALGEDADGNLWAGTPDYGAFRWDGAAWTRFTTADGLGDNEIVSFALDRDGALWAGTDCGGASRLTGSVWTRFTTADGLIGECDVTVHVDRSGVVWFATELGATRYDGERWQSFAPATGFSSVSDLIDIAEDPLGGLWFCGTGEVSRYEPDRTSPQTVLVSSPPSLTGSRQASATYFAGFGEAAGIEFSYRLDGGVWSPWSAINSWLGSGLGDGVHNLEVRSRDRLGNVDATPATAPFEVDATPPEPVIASPTAGVPVRGRLEIRGTASDPRLAGYQVEFRPSGSSSWTPPVATVLAAGTTQVTGGTLATWDTSTLPDGFYDLRLAVTDSLGLTGAALIMVIVDNQLPHAEETAPAIVTAASGGNLFTTNQELHLYFPPHAFDQDALVSIAPAGSVPDTLPSGAVRVTPGYDISWSGVALRKPATMRFNAAPIPPSGTGLLAVYDSTDGSGWRRLGGTVENGAVALAITQPGRYALFADEGVYTGEGSLSGLSFSPRVFSPTGGFANTEVGISFTLGRPGPVTVRVYSRSGRLIREVAAGQPMNAGANLVRWDGRDRNGGYAADGLYIVTVEALGRTERNTLAVVR